MINKLKKLLTKKKNDIVFIRDYPRSDYTVYWEYQINEHNFFWQVTFYNYSDSKPILSHFDQAEEDAQQARLQAQEYILKHIENFKRVA